MFSEDASQVRSSSEKFFFFTPAHAVPTLQWPQIFESQTRSANLFYALATHTQSAEI